MFWNRSEKSEQLKKSEQLYDVCITTFGGEDLHFSRVRVKDSGNGQYTRMTSDDGYSVIPNSEIKLFTATKVV